MFSERTLEEIQARINIVDLVAEYLTLKKSGSGFTALCPFHKEKTPSFHVHPVKQVFHCFGCHKGGNIFTFLRGIEGIPFPQAVQKLAERAGVEIEKTASSHTRRPDPLTSASEAQSLKALEWAAKYFHYLLSEVPEYAFAKKYLSDRGLSQKTIDKFRLGVSPKGWHTLRELMLRRGFKLADLLQAELLIQKDPSKPNTYDRFRERLMFPIMDPKGRVLGFGARILKEEPNQPKYINSAESKIFSKRRHLYGLFENQRDIRVHGEAVVVEGYMDVVGLYEKGVTNALATMGTALTADHCLSLRAHTRRVVTVFDPDSAGRDAWHRSVDLFMESGLFAKDLALPNGQDPDEFVMAEGPDKFYELCQKAPRQITKLLREIAAQGPLSEEERGEMLSKLTPVLIASRKLPDRALIWDSISLVLNVSIEALRELSRPQQRAKAPQADPQQRPTTQSTPKSPPKERRKRLDPTDLQFFLCSLKCQAAFQSSTIEEWRAGIRDPKIRTWLERLHGTGSSTEFAAILEKIAHTEANPELQGAVSSALLETAESSEADQEWYEAIKDRILQRKKELEIKALSTQVRLAQLSGDEKVQFELLARLEQLRGDP